MQISGENSRCRHELCVLDALQLVVFSGAKTTSSCERVRQFVEGILRGCCRVLSVAREAIAANRVSAAVADTIVRVSLVGEVLPVTVALLRGLVDALQTTPEADRMQTHAA